MTFAQSWVSAFTRVALFALVPVFAVVLDPYISDSSGSKIGTALLAALVSLVGTLCVFPVDIPNSIEAGAAFASVIIAAAIVAAANCYAVRLANELPRNALAPMAAISGAVTAFALIVTGALSESFKPNLSVILHDLPWSALVTLPGLLLLFWLMPRISATRMTTRFLLAPLIAILISMAIDRPSVALRIWLGLLLIAAGAAGLLFAPSDDPSTTTSTLNLNRE
jgi:drug/metabolite transporter (DMT)-like permease